MSRPFLDANVLLEVLLVRSKTVDVLKLLHKSETTFCISFLTTHLVYHYCLENDISFAAITVYLESFKILTMDQACARLAQDRYSGKDFEDCLQAACAELGGCDQIITLDKHFQKHSGTKLPVKVL